MFSIGGPHCVSGCNNFGNSITSFVLNCLYIICLFLSSQLCSMGLCVYLLFPYHIVLIILDFQCILKSGGLPWWLRWWRICLQWRRPGFDSWVRKICRRREWQPTPVFLLLDYVESKWWVWSALVRCKVNLPSSPSSISISLRLPGGTGLVQGYTWLKELNWAIICLLPSPGHSFVYCVHSLTSCPLSAFLILMELC